jgi:hypothetical protein
MVSPIAGYVHRVHVPGGIEVSRWAEQHAIRPPTQVPEGWPESTQMCLMVVIRGCEDLSHRCNTRGLLVTRPAAMHAISNRNERLQLWFMLPRGLFSALVCPSLRDGDWPETEGE